MILIVLQLTCWIGYNKHEPIHNTKYQIVTKLGNQNTIDSIIVGERVTEHVHTGLLLLTVVTCDCET